MTISTVFSQALDSNGDGINGYTIVTGFSVAGLSLPDGEIARVRATFQAGTTQGLTITNAYTGHAAGAGDAYDFSTTPVQLLWGGAASKVIALNTEETTDWAEFAYNKTSAWLFAYYLGGGTGSDMARYKTSVANVTDYNKIANDAATVNKTGYATTASFCRCINKLEVETADGRSFQVAMILGE